MVRLAYAGFGTHSDDLDLQRFHNWTTQIPFHIQMEALMGRDSETVDILSAALSPYMHDKCKICSHQYMCQGHRSIPGWDYLAFTLSPIARAAIDLSLSLSRARSAVPYFKAL